MQETTENRLFCSFCGKGDRDVDKLIAGPKTFICNECVSLCREIIDAERIGHREMVAADIGISVEVRWRLFGDTQQERSST